MKSKSKRAWTTLISQRLDRLRVPASIQDKMPPGKILGNKVGLLLSNVSQRKVNELLNDPSISNSLVAINSFGTNGEFLNFHEIGTGRTIMQFLADKISRGDQDFLIDFATGCKPQSERTESACTLYGLMLGNSSKIDLLKSPKEILDFINELDPTHISEDGVENFYKLLREVGLPSGKG